MIHYDALKMDIYIVLFNRCSYLHNIIELSILRP